MTESVLSSALQSIPGVRLEPQPDPACFDLHVDGATIAVRAIGRASGFPRDVREAVWQARSRATDQRQLMVVAPTLTSTSRAWLVEQGVGYADQSGHFFLRSEGIYLMRQSIAKPPGKTPEPDSQSIFQGRSAAVLHALLQSPRNPWHVTTLAKSAGVAPGTAVKVCAVLEKMLWMEREGRGPQSLRRLREPGTLLDHWATQRRPPRYRRRGFHQWSTSPDTLARKVAEVLERRHLTWALTGPFAAMHRSPAIAGTDQICLIVAPGNDIDSVFSETGLTPVDNGANVVVLESVDPGPLLFRQRLDHYWCASDVQLVLDLASMPARGKEQAAHLRRECLGF